MPEKVTTDLFDLSIVAIRPETDSVKTLVLRKTDDTALSFEAGQFITLRLSINGQEIRRSYSLSGLPGEELSITVKRYPNGTASRWLFDSCSPGMPLTADGPHGLFTRSRLPAETSQLFLYAAGVGITPVYSLLRDVLIKSLLPVVLFYSNGKPSEAVFIEALQALEKDHLDRLRIIWFFSNHSQLQHARLTPDNLPRLLKKHVLVPLANTAHYICGPLPYQFSLRTALVSAGVAADRIRTENFDPAPRPEIVVVPEKESRRVVIKIRGEDFSVTVNPPQTILQAAREAGVALPYSCESGRCSACTARCDSGTVWMNNNEVLTDADLKSGLVLTCTGHPIGEGVRIVYD